MIFLWIYMHNYGNIKKESEENLHSRKSFLQHTLIGLSLYGTCHNTLDDILLT